MSTRAAMTMRMYVERDVSEEVDDHNQPVVVPAAFSTVPCFASIKTVRMAIDANRAASITILVAQVPSGTDITNDDIVSSIKDRRGVVLFQGPYRVDNDPARRADHIELTLTRAA